MDGLDPRRYAAWSFEQRRIARREPPSCLLVVTWKRFNTANQLQVSRVRRESPGLIRLTDASHQGVYHCECFIPLPCIIYWTVLKGSFLRHCRPTHVSCARTLVVFGSYFRSLNCYSFTDQLEITWDRVQKTLALALEGEVPKQEISPFCNDGPNRWCIARSHMH